METSDHLDLKRLAVAYLRAGGCSAVGVEVRSPISRFIFDAAGWRDSVSVPRRKSNGEWGMGQKRCDPESVVIECKQSRSDFLRDSKDRQRLIDERRRLVDRRVHLEEHRIKPNEPHLRMIDSSLYQRGDGTEEAWDFSRTKCIEHRDIASRLEQIEREISNGTKFGDIARWGLADRLYLCAPSGLINKHEVPPGWGLIECRRTKLRASAEDPERALVRDVTIRVEAPKQECDADRRVRLLRNIATSTTRAWLKSDDGFSDAAVEIPEIPNVLQTKNNASL